MVIFLGLLFFMAQITEGLQLPTQVSVKPIQNNGTSLGTMAVEFTSNTPAVKDNSSIYVAFKGTSGASAVRCCLREKQYYGAQCTKCLNGEVTFSNLQPATYIMTVVATNGYEKSVSKRIVTVPGTDECAINMINGGLQVENGAATVQFAGVGNVSSYACYLDQVVYDGDCVSPLQLNLSQGWHLLKVVPTGSDCVERKILSLKFVV